ncbi:MAG: ABC transporter [Betaproteobacteria bacterium RIFCSPLOWO2_02_FULL_63_19]|nr:MAG: ABC transporter [Betaproteobacteria bacterium RIFCSPLOWO2_02_FULL_63_19]
MVAIVELDELTVAFGRDASGPPVFDRVSLSVEQGTFVTLVGASGVGKSSLLRVIAGLLPASGGQVRVNAKATPQRRPTALVFQEPRLMPWRSVRENVMFGLEGLVLSKAMQLERANAALALVELADYADRHPRELSGGQRQRVGVARALAVDPDLLLMDEPFAALDAITRHALQEELLRIWQKTRKTVIFVTHDIEEAVYLSDRVVLLRDRPARITQDRNITAKRGSRRNDAEFPNVVSEIRRGLSDEFTNGDGI